MNGTTKNANMFRRVAELAKLAREYHRTGNVTLRDQVEETIREIAPRAYAAKVISEMYDAE